MYAVHSTSQHARQLWLAETADRNHPEAQFLLIRPIHCVLERPTHYFVETLASPTDYELNGQQGQGFAHQAPNCSD